jgi:hypothetical protein
MSNVSEPVVGLSEPALQARPGRHNAHAVKPGNGRRKKASGAKKRGPTRDLVVLDWLTVDGQPFAYQQASTISDSPGATILAPQK